MSDTFLVTGALGCLGAWTCKLLVENGAGVVAYDLGDDPRRLRELMTAEELDGVMLTRGDVTERESIEAAMVEHGVSHVVHLAALQVPFCKADPALGAKVNVLGTVAVFEAASRAGLATSIAYASSAAVYDARGRREPATLYGVYKLANEGTARLYWQDAGVASIGLRPFCVYGPGRDQGLTADPTHAMRAAARGEPYRIGFGGRTELHYAPDVARALIAAARRPPDGADVYDVPGETVHMADVVAAIQGVVPGADVSYENTPLPFPESLPGQRFDAPVTGLAEGIRATIAHFRP